MASTFLTIASCIYHMIFHVILKCVNTWHNMKVSICNIWGVVLCGKQLEDSWQKGGLSRRFREEPCWKCSSKPWQLHERPGEKSCRKPRKLHEGSGKELCWQCSMRSRKLQERLGEELWWLCCKELWELLEGPKKVMHETTKVTCRIRKSVVLTVKHKDAKVTRKAWRRVAEMKLVWLYPIKVKKLQPNRLS